MTTASKSQRESRERKKLKEQSSENVRKYEYSR